jgi:hypothetical protein
MPINLSEVSGSLNLSEVNLSTLVMTGIHSGHKAKVSKPHKGGQTPLEKDTTDQTERQPLLETSSVQGALDMLDPFDSLEILSISFLKSGNFLHTQELLRWK